MFNPRPYQIESKQNTMRLWRGGKKNVLIVAATGLGKAQPLTAKVLTPSGFVVMGALSVGDAVIGGNGKPCEVTGVFPQGIKSVYRITFSDGTSAECCDDHLWAIRSKSQKARGKGFVVKTLREFRDDLQDGSGASKWFVPLVAPIEFRSMPCSIDAYVLGALLGNGGLTCGGVKFSTADKWVVEEMQSRLGDEVLIKYVDGYDYVFFHGKPGRAGASTINILKAHNLWGKASHEKFVPDWYKYNDAETRLNVLRGLLDTDGHIRPSDGHIEFGTTSPQLAQDVVEIVRSLGGTTRARYKKHATYTHNGEKRIGRESYRITVSLKGINPFLLPRKADLWRDNRKQGQTKAVVAVEYVGEAECQCIQVSDPDSLYVTDGYTVTHNTVIFCDVIDTMLKQGDREGRALILSHREELVRQPLDKLLTFFPHWEGKCGIVMADRNDVGAKVISATVQTLASPKRLRQLLAVSPINLVIVDEAHHATSTTYVNVLEGLRAANPNLLVLGVTATPLRADGAAMAQVFDDVAATYDIRYGVGNGYLVPPKWLAIKTGISLKGISASGGDYSATQLAKVFDTDNAFDLVVASHERYAAGRKGICFVNSVIGAYALAAKFTAAGIPAAAADGTTDKAVRAALLRDFREGKIQILCNMGLWTEGLDVPEVDVIHQLRPTRSDGLYLQMVGRGLRPAPWTDKKDCLILDYMPIENRRIVMLGNVLLGDMERKVVEKALEEEDAEEGAVQTGFLFDQNGFKGLEGDPLQLVAEQLDYMSNTPYNWERHKGTMLIGLGKDAQETDRTLWIPKPQEDGSTQVLLIERSKGTYDARVEIVGSGDLGDLLETATAYAEQHANPVLALKGRGWQSEPISDGQATYLRRLAAGDLKSAHIRTMRRGEAARLITYYATASALRKAGLAWAL